MPLNNHAKAYYVGLHRYQFQAGTPAEILGVVMVTLEGKKPCPCYHLKFPDGREDYSPLIDEDFFGQGGYGKLYEIISEEQVRSGNIPAIAA